jgi:hypothetical protein
MICIAGHKLQSFLATSCVSHFFSIPKLHPTEFFIDIASGLIRAIGGTGGVYAKLDLC